MSADYGAEKKIEGLFTSIQCGILSIEEPKWDNNHYQQAQSCWKGPSFFSEGPPASAGVAIFCREGACREINLVHKDKAGRLLIIDIDTGKFQLRIVNVYASNDEIERKTFFLKNLPHVFTRMHVCRRSQCSTTQK